jgi:hypothetical protein
MGVGQLKHLEEIADSLGFSIKLSDTGLITTDKKVEVPLIPKALRAGLRMYVLSSYNDSANGIAVLALKVSGDLGLLIYNTEEGGRSGTSLVLYDKNKLPFTVPNYFESNRNKPVSELAESFDPGLICQLIRYTGESTYSLIEDRRESKGKDHAPVLDGGGTSPSQKDAGTIPHQLPT